MICTYISSNIINKMNKSSGLAFRPYVESIAKLISVYFNQNFEIQSSSLMVFLHGKILIFGDSKIIYIYHINYSASRHLQRIISK